MGIAAALLIGYLIFGVSDTNIHITDSTDVNVTVEVMDAPLVGSVTGAVAPQSVRPPHPTPPLSSGGSRSGR